MNVRYWSYLPCVPEHGLIFLLREARLIFCYSVIMGDGRPCNMEGIGTVQIKLFDGMIREWKEVRYVPQLKKILSQLAL